MVIVLLALGLSLPFALQTPPDRHAGPASCERAHPSLPPRAEAPATYRGFHFGTDATASPTRDKPQNKLWYHDGAWWAVMLDPVDNRVRIFELLGDNSWRRTDAVVDDRLDSTADVRWDGRKLFVATRHATLPLRVLRFSYGFADRAYRLDSGFPVNVNAVGTSSATIEHDSAGRLWVAYVHARQLWLAHSTVDQLTWTPPFVPNLEGVNTAVSDIAALIRFGGHVGLMWSNQATDAFYFAVHADDDPPEHWSVERALGGAGMVDNHIDLKSDSAGRIYAVVKTSQGDDGELSDSPLTLLLIRSPDRSWSQRVFGTVADNHTRPIAVIDEDNEHIYIFATKGENVVYKRTSLADPSFTPGPGSPFVSYPSARLQDATSSDHPVTSESGIVVLANSMEERHYYHALLDLSGEDTDGPRAPDLRTSIGFRAASTGATATARSLTLNRPVGVVEGDLLLASLDTRGNSPIVEPHGWKLVRTDENGTTMRKATFFRIASSTEPQSYVWQLSGSGPAAGMILAYSGVDAARPIQASNGQANVGSQLISAPSTSVAARGAWLVGLFAAAVPSDLTPPPSMAERAAANVSARGWSIAGKAADASCSSTGPTGDRTAEASSSSQSVGQLVVLRPAAARDPGPAQTPASSRVPVAPTLAPTATRSPAAEETARPPSGITFREASAAVNTTNAFITIDRPAGVVPGDLMLASIDFRGLPDIAAPFGWEFVRLDTNGRAMRKATYVRIADSAEPSWYTWFLSRPAAAVGVIVAYAGVDQASPIESSGGQSHEVTSTSVGAPSVAATTPGALLVGLFGVAAVTMVAPPPNMDMRIEAWKPEAEHNISSLAADVLLPDPGPTGQLVAMAQRAGRSIGQVVVLRPAH